MLAVRLAAVDARRAAWLLALAYAVLFFPIAGSLVASFTFTPEQFDAAGGVLLPECSARALLGSACPTCGLSRAFSALSHGRWDDAVALHSGAPLAYAAWWLLGGASAAGLAGALADVRRPR